MPATRVPAALALVAVHRPVVRRAPGATFAKMLGTGDGRTFTVRDASPTRWALLACWRTERHARAFVGESPVLRHWMRLATEQWYAELRPLASRGRWSRREPFGTPTPYRHPGPVAAVTRARLSPSKAWRFWRAAPLVAADLRHAPGLRVAVGIGELPVGLQGTFSVWDSADDMTAFAYARQPHATVVRRTAHERWYAEQLFARLAVVTAHGTIDGVDPLA